MNQINKKKIKNQVFLSILVLFYSKALQKYTTTNTVFYYIDLLIHYLFVPWIAVGSIKRIINNNYRLPRKFLFPYLIIIVLSIDSLFVGENTIASAVSLIKVYFTIMVAEWIFITFTIEEVIYTFFVCQIIILVAQGIYFLLNPLNSFSLYEDALTFSGSFPHKNHLSNYMAFVISLLYSEIIGKDIKNKLLYFLVIILSLILMLQSRGMSGIFSCFIIIAVYTIVNKKGRMVNISVCMIGLNYFAIALTNAGENIQAIFSKYFNRDLTFTGRTIIWKMIQEYINKRPFTGYGYCSFWEQTSGLEYSLLKYGSAHNGWKEFILQFGYPGMILIMALYIVIGHKLKNLVHNHSLNEYRLEFVFLISQLLYMITERSFQPFHYHTLFFAYCVIRIYCKYEQEINSARGC